MKNHTLNAPYVDIMIFAEGTYPYIRGGVSSWIHQLMSQLPMFSFGICFIGSKAEDYDGIKYDFPKNLIHLETHFMFDSNDTMLDFHIDKPDVIKKVAHLHQWFKTPDRSLPEELRKLSFYLDEATEDYFLHHKDVWDYITKKYESHCPDVPFVDYFWALRNMHKPIWTMARIAENLPKIGINHSPSTGYAGFLATLASYHNNTPLFISEHGIYTRERKIDLLNADWISYHKPILQRSSEEINYIKHMWINFFSKIGAFSYGRADKIFSLFPQAKEVQKNMGASPEKLEVIPNGVDTVKLGNTLKERPDKVPHIITLIGRVVAIKDIKTFIRAIKIVTATIPDIEGWIAGPLDEDVAYAEECQNMVTVLGLKKNIKFLGFQNILDLLPKTGILTLTSISEGMPLVILEGFAAGVPCVATNVGSCQNLIEGALDDDDIALGSAGIVTNIANPKELSEAYIKLLHNEDLWKKMQETALKRVNRYYKQESFLKRYQDHYERVLT